MPEAPCEKGLRESLPTPCPTPYWEHRSTFPLRPYPAEDTLHPDPFYLAEDVGLTSCSTEDVTLPPLEMSISYPSLRHFSSTLLCAASSFHPFLRREHRSLIWPCKDHGSLLWLLGEFCFPPVLTLWLMLLPFAITNGFTVAVTKQAMQMLKNVASTTLLQDILRNICMSVLFDYKQKFCFDFLVK